MGESFEFPRVDKIAVGAIGEPGARLFLLQCSYLGELVTIKVEKVQISSLVEYLTGILERLDRPGHVPEDVVLEEPMVPIWAASQIAIGYSPTTDTIDVEFTELIEDEESAGKLRCGLTKEQAAYLSIEGTRLVRSGRPPCPLCGYPLDNRGHVCPKTNGNSAPII